MKISVIVTSHKGTEPYLEECLESIMAQTTKPHEIILVIDGYEKPMVYPGVTTILRDVNKGVAFSRHEGVKVMTGDFILFVDADDVLPENFLAEMESAKQKFGADITYPGCILWSRWGGSKKENGYFMPQKVVTRAQMLKYNQVVVTSLMPKAMYDKLGGFDDDLDLYEDWEFFLRAMDAGYTFHRAPIAFKYRQRTQSRNHADSSVQKRIIKKIRSSFE